jgi:hypothetical protein
LVFITRRKGFQKIFENAFEILEKEKEIEIDSTDSLVGHRRKLVDKL